MIGNARSTHCYDLVNTNTVRDTMAELDHFALRSSSRSAVPENGIQLATTEHLVRYGSLAGLRSLWKRLDRRETARWFSAVLLLPPGFERDLHGLIRRQHPAQRLLITSTQGRMPDIVSSGDLVLDSKKLGWDYIGFYKNLPQALASARRIQIPHEHYVMFVPETCTRHEASSNEQDFSQWESRLM